MLGRIALVTIVVGCLLVAVSKGSLLERVGLLGSCREVQTPRGLGGSWRACSWGRLAGRPDLRRDACHSRGIVDGLEYWQCPARIAPTRGLAG